MVTHFGNDVSFFVHKGDSCVKCEWKLLKAKEVENKQKTEKDDTSSEDVLELLKALGSLFSSINVDDVIKKQRDVKLQELLEKLTTLTESTDVDSVKTTQRTEDKLFNFLSFLGKDILETWY